MKTQRIKKKKKNQEKMWKNQLKNGTRSIETKT